MNVNRAFTPQEKKVVIIAMAIILILVGLTRPMWSRDRTGAEASANAATAVSETVLETAGTEMTE